VKEKEKSARNEGTKEIFISWIELFFVVFISASYFLTQSRLNSLQLNTVSILLVGFLIFSVMRTLLTYQKVKENKRQKDLSKFMSPDVAQRATDLKNEIHPGFAELKRAVILNMDMRDFTKLSNALPQEELMKILSEYQSRVTKIVEKHGGTVDKFMGDGILTHFGAANESDSFAADAMRAAEALLEDFEDWNEDRKKENKSILGFGMSLVSGDVIYGAVGTEERMELTVFGDTVNLSAKLEKYTKILDADMICTHRTYEIARFQGFESHMNTDTHTATNVRGLRHPIELVVFTPNTAYKNMRMNKKA
jgi:adenylate cyclase